MRKAQADSAAQVVVFGASGRLGRLLQGIWASDGPGRLNALWIGRREHAAMRGEKYVSMDILETPAAELRDIMAGAEAVLNLAGQTDMAAVKTPLKREQELVDHARIAEKLVKAAAKAGTPLLTASSAAVYGALGADGQALHEDMELPALPLLSDYGAAKRQAEDAAREAASTWGGKLTTLRIGNVAGVDAALGGWRPGFTLDRFPNGVTPRRSYIGPVQFAGTMRSLLEQAADPALPAVINVAAPGTIEMADVLREAHLAFEIRPAPQHAIAAVQLDVSRLLARVPISNEAGTAANLIAEWKSWKRIDRKLSATGGSPRVSTGKTD